MKLTTSRIIGYGLVLVLSIALLYSIFGAGSGPLKEIPLSQVIEDVDAGRIERIIVKDDELTVVGNNGVEYLSRKEPGTSLAEVGIDPRRVVIEVKDTAGSAIWITLISSLLPFLLIFGFLWFMLRQAQGASNQALSFGRSRARMMVQRDKDKITFKDVAGSHEAKQELMEVVEFLKYPSKFLSIGARIPKGVLLLGPPGTGKTLLAKAVAGEAGVPFFNISGSEFVEMFVGVGASRVRDLFAKAKRNAPAIVFIDEIDAVGRQRGAGLGGSHDEREQTLNQILVEMDGFETDTNVIIIAATNRPDVLDPALLRPGRFDRRVMLDRPDIQDRKAILDIHAKGKPFEEDVDLGRVASQTPGFTGADLYNLINEAAILAARYNKKRIGQHELTEALEKVLLGPERRNKVLTDEEKKITAYHEAGHAIVSHILPLGDPVHKISIVSRGMALGYTWSMPTHDKYLHSKSKFADDLAVMLGGRAAELLIFKEATTGAANDLQQATDLARRMVMRFGMSEKLGPVALGSREELVFLGREIHEQKNYSEKVAAIIDDEVASLINSAVDKAVVTLKKYHKELDAIAARLIEKETIDHEDFAAFFPGITKDDS
ncbi:cell division protein FtsH [candidate division Kazan bacterium RBG_13_50_9]|uniref:ATP-dependent zinc metalloprotease FtsH n=1 Tax=candidate division Kazan bacterium RBG_13_50_9 TaxID=1798535 RepID=A0A1F4NSB9_UNCK3|nr:MAG: cell division protein FtsH [candidate division Kazan bacterium RBG_13_50_9]